ncbi:MAG: hypothetical protein ACP5OU_09215 [Methanothrix sp.]
MLDSFSQTIIAKCFYHYYAALFLSLDRWLRDFRKGTVMRKTVMLAIISAIIISSMASASDQFDRIEIRGEVAFGNFTWDAQNFAGFYYDIDQDI